jgi:hypothetical protein
MATVIRRIRMLAQASTGFSVGAPPPDPPAGKAELTTQAGVLLTTQAGEQITID